MKHEGWHVMAKRRHPDYWDNKGRYRTRPDGSLYPREERRLKEMMKCGAGNVGEVAAGNAAGASTVGHSPAPNLLGGEK